MVWDFNYPEDGPGNIADQALRNTKVLIRERAVLNNGSYNEHSFFGSGATGQHPLSQIGFVQIHSSYTTMVAGAPYNPGSLHYAIGSGLYVVDTNGALLGASTIDHTKLIIDQTDYHTQYYLRSGSRPMLTELRYDSTVIEVNITTNNDDALPSTHDSMTWMDAHGSDGEYILSTHFLDGSQPAPNSAYESPIYVSTGGAVFAGTSKYNFWPDVQFNPSFGYSGLAWAPAQPYAPGGYLFILSGGSSPGVPVARQYQVGASTVDVS